MKLKNSINHVIPDKSLERNIKVFMELETYIIELEKSLLTFEVRHSEVELRKRIAPEFKEIGASGAYFGLDSVFEQLPAEKTWSVFVQDFEFKLHSPEMCQLIFHAFIKNNDSDEGMYSLRSSFWKKFDDGWKIIFHQGTEVEPFELLP